MSCSLCRNSPQGVGAEEEVHGPAMVSALLGTGPRVAAQPGNAWPPRGVAACQGLGVAGAWAHRLGWRRRPPLLLDARWLGGTCGGLPVDWRPLRPQGRGPR